MNEQDEEWMRRAIHLAKKGEGATSPNPMVGAVIVKEGRCLGEGYHQHCGGPHAERNALAACREAGETGESVRGAALYVTLEPCCHQGRTPPCTEAIIEAGIGRVVIGSGDPNPQVSGKGAALLREAGVEVKVMEGAIKRECDRINRIFFHYIRTGTPYISMKYAMTADGKIAARTGESKWITGEKAREHVHQLRGSHRGILVGIGTVLADDPLLNCRLPGGRNPIRIICDSDLRLPLDSQIARTAKDIPTIVAAADPDSGRRERLEALGITVLDLPGKAADESVDLMALMKTLGDMEIDSLLLEGGGTLNDSALRAGIVQRVYAYVAPKLFGGAEAKTPVEGLGCERPGDCIRLSRPELHWFGEDLLLEYEVLGGETLEKEGD